MKMNIAGAILMGGKATRMGGQQKGLLLYQGSYFYEHLERSLSIFDIVYLSVAKDNVYPQTRMPLIVDKYEEIGPMGGICSVLEHCEQEAIFVVPCDTPKISKMLIEKVYAFYQEHRCGVVVKDEQKIHPLIGIYPRAVLSVLQQKIEKKQYKMISFIEEMKFAYVAIEDFKIDRDEVVNINSLRDFSEL